LDPQVFWANLMHFILRILKLVVLRVPLIQILTQNGELKVLVCEFHRKTILTTLFKIIWNRNKTAYPEL
jgi:hypothetical protein